MRYTHVLTEVEQACGVTIEDVARVLPQGLFIRDGAAFMLPKLTPPALAASVARCAFGGANVEFSHLSSGYPVYVKVES